MKYEILNISLEEGWRDGGNTSRNGRESSGPPLPTSGGEENCGHRRHPLEQDAQARLQQKHEAQRMLRQPGTLKYISKSVPAFLPGQPSADTSLLR